MEKYVILIGRSKECDIVIDHKNISRRHAKIFVDKNGIKLKDLNSKFGTYLITNESKEKIEEIEITKESIIALGGVCFAKVSEILTTFSEKLQTATAENFQKIYSDKVVSMNKNKRCSECGSVISISARLCETCGHKYEVNK